MAFQGYRMGNKLKSVIGNGTVFLEIKSLFTVGDGFRNIVPLLNGDSPGFKLESQIRLGIFVVFIVGTLKVQTRFIAVIVNVIGVIRLIAGAAISSIVVSHCVGAVNQFPAIVADVIIRLETSPAKCRIRITVIFRSPVSA